MFQQYTNRATRISLVVFLMTIQFDLNGLLMLPAASAQQPAGQQVFVPPAIRSVDSNKLRAMAKPRPLSAPEKMKLLTSMPSVGPRIKSTNLWKPVLRLTPRNSFFSTPTLKAYWFFNEVVCFTPHLFDDDGVALFVKPADGNGNQMELRFAGTPGKLYAVDVTLGIGGNTGTNTYRVRCDADGNKDSEKKFEFKTGPIAKFEHLLFDLAPSTSGQYIVAISMISNTRDPSFSWWYFSSLEVGMVE